MDKILAAHMEGNVFMRLIVPALLCVFVLLLSVGLYTRRMVTLDTAAAIVVVWSIFLLAAMLTVRLMLPAFMEPVTDAASDAEFSEAAGRILPAALALLFELLLCSVLGFYWARWKQGAAQRLVRRCREWSSRLSPYFCLRLVVVLLALLIMWRFAGRRSLWYDDVATIHFVAGDVPLSTNIARTLGEARYNPPLFYVLAYFWLRIMPYGTAYLKLLSILFCCVGIWLCGTAAKQIAGGRAALIATIFAATSTYLIRYAAFTFRCFGLMFMLCALLIVSYHKRLTEQEKICHYISYGLIHALLLYTNYICGLITAVLGLYDLWLFARKKIKVHFLWSYIGAGLAFLPLILYVLTDMIESHANFWPGVPYFSTLRDTIFLVFSNHVFLLALFVFAAVLACAAALRGTDVRKEGALGMGPEVVAALVLWFLFVIGFSFVFSRYLYPSSSIFVDRYFISVLAPAVIAAAAGMDRILDALSEDRGKAASGILTCAGILICFIYLESSCISTVSANPGTTNEPYEQATNWICEQEDAYGDRCLVMMTSYQGGLYYYATQGGRRPNLNFGSLNKKNWKDYDVVYIAQLHGEIFSGARSVLDAHYEEAERRNDIKVVKYRKIT